MKPVKFSESIEISGTPQQLFDYTQDYGKRLHWDTFLIKAELLNGATAAGKGVKSWCVAKNGLGMETEYVSFNPPKVVAVKMTKGPYMFREFASSWNFRAATGGRVVVTFLYSFTLRFPFSLAPFVVKNILKRNVRQRLKDLEQSAANILSP